MTNKTHISIRVSQVEKDKIRAAALLSGLSLNAFVAKAAYSTASEVLTGEPIFLDAEAYDEFVSGLSDPSRAAAISEILKFRAPWEG
jgi:uncharacterized protein (DUF1778 family)